MFAALVRHPTTHQLASALRDDLQPSAGIFLKTIAFEWIKLVTNKNGDRHCPTPRSNVHGALFSRCNVQNRGRRRIDRHPFPAATTAKTAAEDRKVRRFMADVQTDETVFRYSSPSSDSTGPPSINVERCLRSTT